MTSSHRTAPRRPGAADQVPGPRASRSGGSRRAAPRRSRDRTGTGKRRGRTLLVLALSLVVLATAGAGWLYFRLTGNIETFASDGISKDRPAATSGKGENVLVIGSDARTNGNNALGGGESDDVGRSDTAFLLHIYADHKHAVAISIPRDTLVEIPPCKLPDGTWSKTQLNTMFNAAYSVGQTAAGNPACTQNTVETLTGLRVDHTIAIDFKGFAAITDAVGGVEVCVPQDIYQKDLSPGRATRGSLIFSKGEQTVEGQKALDFVRLRHGIGDGSDIGRIKRQQAFVSSLIKKVKTDGLTPTKLLPLADAATKSMTVDPGLGSADKLISFAMSMQDIDLHNTKFVTVPWRYEGARVAVVQPDADALFAALKDDRTLDNEDASGKTASATASPSATPSPSASVSGAGIAVTVYNGTTVAGLAARGAETLTTHGFTVSGTATAPSQDHADTLIAYGADDETGARTLARLFPDAELKAVSTPGIQLILGQAYADSPAGAGSATTSPAPTSVPSSVPSSVAAEARSADDDLCSNLSYG